MYTEVNTKLASLYRQLSSYAKYIFKNKYQHDSQKNLHNTFKKMYYLVLWTESEPPTTSVLPEKCLKIKKRAKTTAKWGNEWFEARIILCSNDADYLNTVMVDTTGHLMTPERRKSFPTAVLSEKRKIAEENKKIKTASNLGKKPRAGSTKSSLFNEQTLEMNDTSQGEETCSQALAQNDATSQRSKKLDRQALENDNAVGNRVEKSGTATDKAAKRRIIYSDESDDDEEQRPDNLSEQQDDHTLAQNYATDQQSKKLDGQALEDEKTNHSQAGKVNTVAKKTAMKHRLLFTNESDDEEQLDGEPGRTCNDAIPVEELHDQNLVHRNAARDDHMLGQALENHDADPDGAVPNRPLVNNNVNRGNRDFELPDGVSSDNDAENDDPQREPELRDLLVSNKPDEGKIRLVGGIDIFVDATELNYIKGKWRGKPEEHVRRLMKLIVGRNELKNMTATGWGGRTKIPPKVFKAVFFYVNKKLPKYEEKLTEARYRRVLTNMCNTLRNPKRKK